MVTSADALEVSVVMPCLNEEHGVGLCVEKARAALERAGITGEVIVVDNGSVDRSRDAARKAGATVIEEPRRGYGAAYLCGMRHARGRYIVMGDSDNSYDFGDIVRFLAPLKQGADLVMGSRFKGTIRKGAMPWTHRYIGNPVLSFMTRLFFSTSLSDIHCGMRALTRESFHRMRLTTLGMEFATEMVVAALTNRMRICEVPIHYHPRQGRSKLRALFDAWRHIRFMLLFCPVWLYLVPGMLGFALGTLVQLMLVTGPVEFLGHRWDTHFMAVASVLSIMSYQIVNMGVFAHTFAIRQGFIKVDAVTGFFQRHFSLEKGLVLGGVAAALGTAIIAVIVGEWLGKQFGAMARMRELIVAMTLMVIGVQTVFSSFLISMLFLERK
jgi:hypothetical protein